MRVLLLSIFAHILSDFVFQTTKMIKEKDAMILKGFLYHGLSTFVAILILLIEYNFFTTIIYATIITLVHVIVDYYKARLTCDGKNTIEYEKRMGRSLVLFLTDQIVHIISIIFIWKSFDFTTERSIIKLLVIIEKLFPFKQNVVEVINNSNTFIDANFKLFTEKQIIYAIIYAYICFGGAVFVPKFLDFLYKKIPNYTEKMFEDEISQIEKQVNIGKYIGIMERALILTIYIEGSITGIAAVITTKSLARFSKLNNKDFAEYYLIGTFTSFSLAIAGGLLLKFILK
ncbi:DUF3307 domain-containing protein [Clostridiisalibacter paucivorans]|uniref:DUF3307 domain-containing protein n=1 Tax=Clostridiisalibacter paucivorans TaxID=408753 RepID=UPI00047D9851|nr:DUF3307 domain-containing protein [Clostridiisalibacter paucivorans]